MGESLRGQKTSWNLLQKISEGDAGEIWLAKSTGAQPITGIIKRPVQGSFGSEKQRQAGQITSEGRILGVIGGLNVKIAGATMQVVSLLDSSDLDGEISTNVFIVLERAAGFDLQFLQKSRRSSDFGDIEAEEREFLEKFSKLDRFPELLLTRMVAGLAALLEKLHNHSITLQGKTWSGVVWNDVKINHIFWDPFHAVFTVIDWGNAQLLGESHVSADRRFSPEGDFLQYCDEMKGFLGQASPDLLTVLPFNGYRDNPAGAVRAVQRHAVTRAEQSDKDLQRLRQDEKSLKPGASSSLSIISARQKYAERIIAFGEAPDKNIWERYLMEARRDDLLNLRLDDFKLASVAIGSKKIPGWEFLNELFRLMGAALDPSDDGDKEALKKILAAAEQEDWIEVFWILRSLVLDPAPTWWTEVNRRLRERIIGAESSIKPPWEVLKSISSRFLTQDDSVRAELLFITENWKEMEPTDEEGQNEQDLIEYKQIERIRELLEKPHSEDWRSLEQALRQPRKFAGATLDAWKGQNFEYARKLLRSWLVYDPDRSRIFTIEAQIRLAVSWLENAQTGPNSGAETIPSFAASMVRAGKLLTQVAPGIPWLDERINILKELERGDNNIQRALRFRNVIQYFPWMEKHSREKMKIWIEEDAEQFYQDLQDNDHDRALDIATTSSLNSWPVYAMLAGSFKKLEKNLYSRSREPIWKTTYQVKDFSSEDDRIRVENALAFLSWMEDWQNNLLTKDIATARKELDAASAKFNEWILIGGVKATLDRAQSLIDVLGIGPGNWDVVSRKGLPQPLQDMLQHLVEAVEAWKAFAQNPAQRWKGDFLALSEHVFTASSALQEWDKALPKEPLEKILIIKSGDYRKLGEQVKYLVEVTRAIRARYQELSQGSKRDKGKDKNLLTSLISLEKWITGKKEFGLIWEREYPQKGWPQFHDPVLTNEKHPLYPWYITAHISGFGGCVIGASALVVVILGLIFLPNKVPGMLSGEAEPTPTGYFADVPVNTEIPASPTLVVEKATLTPVPTLTPTTAFPAPGVETSTLTPVPTLTQAPTFTSISLGDECEQFEKWAATGDWSSYEQGLVSLEKTYGELRQTCHWSYSYRQQVMDAGLLRILSEWNKGDGKAITDLQNLHIQSFHTTPPYLDTRTNLASYDYVSWWRATLAICNLPQDLNTTQADILKSYLPVHLKKFHHATDIFLDVCGWTDADLTALNKSLDHAGVPLSDSSSLLAMPGWPIVISKGCAFLGDRGNARWFLQPGQMECPLPALEGIPNWEASYALTTRFCVVQAPDNPSFTFWLHQPSADLGLRFETNGKQVTKLTNEIRLPNFGAYQEQELGSVLADSFPYTPGSLQARCDSNFVEMFSVQSVWVANLLFWRIRAMDGNAGGEPALLPLVAGVWPIADAGQPVDFYWDMDANSQTIYLLIRNLDLSEK